MTGTDEFRACFTSSDRQTSAQYRVLASFGCGYAALSPRGLPCLLIPLVDLPADVAGRQSAGCELLAYAELLFSLEGRTWRTAAAALHCTDLELLDTFSVLAIDIAESQQVQPSWATVLAQVQRWFALLRPRGRMSVEAELGLWGELWFLSRATRIDQLFAAWRGPEGDETDFFLDSVGAEVKTSTSLHRHYVSQRQLTDADTSPDRWMLSLCVKADPSVGESATLGGLIDGLLSRIADKPAALRALGAAGYSPLDRGQYGKAYVPLHEPTWFALSLVPRVRAADKGVSALRYQITLEDTPAALPAAATRLWQHFHGYPYTS